MTTRNDDQRTANEATREIFHNQVAAFDRQDIDGIFKFFGEDPVFVDMYEADNPRHGFDAFRAYLEEFFERIPDLSAEIASSGADGDVMFGELVVRGTYHPEPGASEQSTVPVTIHYCIVDFLKDGAIVREHIYWDSAELAKQLGLTPTRFRTGE